MIVLQSLDSLIKNKKYIFHNVKDVKTNWSHIENDLMGSVKNSLLWIDIMKECKKNYKRKEKIEVYKTWKGRFILQTTGPRFLSRYFKTKFPKYKPLRIAKTKHHQQDKKDFYVMDYKMNTWIQNKVL